MSNPKHVQLKPEDADKVLQLKNKLTDYRSELEKSDAP